MDQLASSSPARNESISQVKSAFYSDEKVFEIHPSSLRDPKYRKFKQAIISWFHKYIPAEASTISDLAEDLSDGLLIGKFIESITKKNLNGLLPSVSYNSRLQNLKTVLNYIHRDLGVNPDGRWSVETIADKDIKSMMCLLADLAHALNCPNQLPSHFSIAVCKNENLVGVKRTKTTIYTITDDETKYYLDAVEKSTEQASVKPSKQDAFDLLFLPGKEAELAQVIHLLTTFVNQHLNFLSIKISDLATEMHDGVYVIIMIGCIGDFFVPLCRYKIKPENVEDKLGNITFAFGLLESMGIKNKRWNAVDIAKKDLKAVLRLLYDIFYAFKSITEDT